MIFAYGILVDYKGRFLSALRWDNSGPAPDFNAPRKHSAGIKPKDLKTLLTDQNAIDTLIENGRWDFVSKSWKAPTTTWYLINTRGGLAGIKKRFPDDGRPDIPPGKGGHEWITEAPPKAIGQKPHWTGTAWVFPRLVAMIDDTGLVQNVSLENKRSDNPTIELPVNWERFDDDSSWPNNSDGNRVGKFNQKDDVNAWHDFNFTVSKSRIETVITNQGLVTEFTDFLTSRDLGATWQALADEHRIKILSPYVIEFARSLTYTRTQIVNFVRNQLKE